jgi:photosystem II stability/assembly factor-like uncharacterized protein
MGSVRARLGMVALVPFLILSALAAGVAAPQVASASTTMGDSTWFWRNPRPQGNAIYDLSCPNHLSCFAATGGILHSANGGATWVSEATGISSIRSVTCPSSLRCLAVSWQGTVIATVDGGVTWSAQPLPIGWNFYFIRCPSNDVCYTLAMRTNSIRGSPPEIWATTDGGTSWIDRTPSPSSSGTILGFGCSATSTCFATGDSGQILRTTSGGVSWTALTSGTTDALSQIVCPSSVVCDIIAGAGVAILATADGGASWTRRATGIPAGATLLGISCPSVSTCYAVGSQGLIMGTPDGGITWSAQASATTNSLISIDCGSLSDCAAGGYFGTLIARANASAWFASTHGSTVTLTGVSCDGTGTCMAVGAGGIALVSTDSGESWTQHSTATTQPLHGISCATATTCFAVGDGGTIEWTRNTGTTWNQTVIGTGSVRGISCPSAMTCVAVGDAGVVTTSDGGVTWTVHSNSFPLNGVSCPNTVNCWAVGVAMAGNPILSVTLTPQYVATQQNSGPAINLQGVACPTSSACFAVDIYAGVLSTTDGGTTWHQDAMPSGFNWTLYGVACSSATACVADGVEGIISTHDGNSWTVERSDAVGLGSATCRPVCLVAGSDGAILSASAPPDPPTDIGAIAGEGTATVYWSESLSGNVPITSYTITPMVNGVPQPAVVIGGTPPPTHGSITGLTDGVGYSFTVSATNASGPSGQSAASDVVVPGRGAYHALPPARILDTRDGTGTAPTRPLRPIDTLTVAVTGVGGVPATAVAAVVLNVTVTNTTSPSYLTVWPAGTPQPLASNLNFVAGQTVPNLVEVAVGTNGQVSMFNAYGKTDVIFDVAGYVATPTAVAGPDGLNNPIVPFRILDTRNGTGVAAAPIGPNATITVTVTGVAGSNVPATGVSAVVLNVTVTSPTAGSYLTVFPTGASQPVVSNLNFAAGQTVANRVIVKVGTNGSVSIYNAYGNVQVVADIGGWVTDGVSATTGARFVGVIPARILDTRNGTGGVSAPVGPNASIPVPAAGVGGVPAMNAATPPSAVVLNVTVTNPTAGSYLTVWPDGAPSRPLASDLNFGTGKTVPNLVVVKLGSNGLIDLYNAYGSVDVIIDVVGWYG